MSTPPEPSLSARLKRTHLTSKLGESLNKEVVLAGWVHDVRVLGGISFLLLRDMSGIVQVTAPKAKAPDEVLKEIASLHQEDVLFVRGMVVASKIAKKGIEVIPSELEVVSRAETPLPLDPRGFRILCWRRGSTGGSWIFVARSRMPSSRSSRRFYSPSERSFFFAITWRFSRL